MRTTPEMDNLFNSSPVKASKKKDMAAIKRFEAAVRADEMKGAQRPEDAQGIVKELNKARANLLARIRK